MAYSKNQFIPTIALCAILVMASLDFTGAQTGVCYGRLGNNLPNPSEVVALLNQNNIRRVRIYDPHGPTLQALSGTNIEVILGVPNTDLQNVAASQANADTWVRNNVRNYPNVRFRYIAVGNEVSPVRGDTSQFVSFVLPALRNIQNAVNSAGLGGRVRVSTVVETGLIGVSYPPADGAFRPDVASYINPIIRHLVDNRAPLLANIYPYFSYIGNRAQIDLRYALFTSPDGVVAGGVRYQNLFYAILDSLYAALERSGGSSLEVVVAESGWPSAGGDTTTVEYARTYNTNLVQRVRNGTPRRPGRAIETYIFALFDENQKNPEYERHFGVFLPNRQPKYQISFA
ncbi:beta-1-3-glucanase 1 [Striga hermonthica]|uniref:Beta-1-3-glucanase 1 n=1 Tax=Striga hermonthica TaxID=68872 RepID=A0A9N7RS71_STRHE|nr:beta-1-3-glucanase 1 [Striga hermonthica]